MLVSPNESPADKLADNKLRVAVRMAIRSDKTAGLAVCLPRLHQPRARPQLQLQYRLRQLQRQHPLRQPRLPAVDQPVSIRRAYPHCPVPSRSQRRPAYSTSSRNLTAHARRAVSAATRRHSRAWPQRTTGMPVATFSPAQPQTCSARTHWTARTRIRPTSISHSKRLVHTATPIP